MTETGTNLGSPATDSEAEEGINREKARRGARLLLEAVGEDPEDEELIETWQRRVPKTLETLTQGSRPSEKPELRTFEADGEELIVKTGIPVYSLCEHHLLPYHGVAHVGYRPKKSVVGLSKLPRYVRWKARDLTIQERLTRDIATGLQNEIDAETVFVEITATHLCEAMRGVETATETTTMSTAGEPTASDRNRFRTAINNTE